MLIGNVGRAPTFHKMQNDKELCKFTLATTRKWRQNGELQEDTAWHNVVVFNPYLVEIAKKMIDKGTRVFVEGETKTRSYEKDGVKQYINEIIIPQVKGDLWCISGAKGWDDNKQPGPSATPDSPYTDVDELDDIPF